MDEKKMSEAELVETVQNTAKEVTGDLEKKFAEQLAEMKKDHEEKINKIREEAALMKAKTGDQDYGKKVLDRLVLATIKGRGNYDDGVRSVKSIYETDKSPFTKGAIEVFEKMSDYKKTAGSLNMTHLSEGGIFFNETVAPEVYELMIPTTVTDKIRGLNMVTLTGGFEVLCEKTLPTASNKAETSAVNATSGTFEKKRMEGKEIFALYPISNRAIRESRLPAAQLASSMLLRSFIKKRESDFMRGDGEAAAVQGLYSLAANTTAASATITLAQVMTSIRKYLLRHIADDDNLSVDDVTFITSEREKVWFDTYINGTYETRPTVIGNGTIAGKPIISSNAVPSNLTVATVTYTSELYAVVGNGLVYGMGPEIYLEFVPNAAYLNSSGTAEYGASQDNSAVKIVGVHDLLKLNTNAVQLLNKTLWGKN